jgi:DNA-directed RNA polymerase subunit RPC12/RpoP
MKTVANTPTQAEIYIEEETDYVCRNCGSRNNGIVEMSGTTYRHATLLDLNGALGDIECDEDGDFSIDTYRCLECGEEQSDIELFCTLEEFLAAREAGDE